jgi:hypothetical protein
VRKQGFKGIPERAFLDDQQLVHHLQTLHPQFKGQFDKDEVIIDGELLRPRDHMAMHAVLENQLQIARMGFVRQALEALVKAGADEHEARHILGEATYEMMRPVMELDEDYDEVAHAERVSEAVAGYRKRRRAH